MTQGFFLKSPVLTQRKFYMFPTRPDLVNWYSYFVTCPDRTWSYQRVPMNIPDAPITLTQHDAWVNPHVPPSGGSRNWEKCMHDFFRAINNFGFRVAFFGSNFWDLDPMGYICFFDLSYKSLCKYGKFGLLDTELGSLTSVLKLKLVWFWQYSNKIINKRLSQIM